MEPGQGQQASELEESEDSSNSDEESSANSEDAEVTAPQTVQTDHEDDMDIAEDEENVVDDEEEPRAGRGGIGSARGGIGSGRSGIGMSFAQAGASLEGEKDDPNLILGFGRKGGIGSGSLSAGIGVRKAPTFAASTGIQSSKQTDDGDESARSGVGSTNRSNFTSTQASSSASPLAPGIHSNSGASIPQEAGLPTAFGTRTQRAFVRDTQPSKPGIAPVQLSYEEKTHFSKIAGSFGARMMAKMGWEVVSHFVSIASG